MAKTESYTSYGAVPFFRKNGTVLFLLVKHAAGHWGFPKGHQDWGETPLETAKRELREETGITGADIRENVRFEEHYQYREGDTTFDKTVVYFLAEVSEDDNRTPDEFEKEIPAMQWLPFREAMETLTYGESKEILREAARKI